MVYTPTAIKDHTVSSSIDGKAWLPARGENYKFESFRSRLRNAWRVLTGRYDALDWEGH